jgi:hypothetical protein
MIKVWSCLLLVGFADCVSRKNEVEGVFTRTIDNQYALGDDTIFIKAINKSTYQIEKRSKFQRPLKKRGKMSPVEFQKRIWTGSYDGEHNLIMETNQGKVIIFSDDKDLITMGSLEYKRVDVKD